MPVREISAEEQQRCGLRDRPCVERTHRNFQAATHLPCGQNEATTNNNPTHADRTAIRISLFASPDYPGSITSWIANFAPTAETVTRPPITRQLQTILQQITRIHRIGRQDRSASNRRQCLRIEDLNVLNLSDLESSDGPIDLDCDRGCQSQSARVPQRNVLWKQGLGSECEHFGRPTEKVALRGESKDELEAPVSDWCQTLPKAKDRVRGLMPPSNLRSQTRAAVTAGFDRPSLQLRNHATSSTVPEAS